MTSWFRFVFFGVVAGLASLVFGIPFATCSAQGIRGVLVDHALTRHEHRFGLYGADGPVVLTGTLRSKEHSTTSITLASAIRISGAEYCSSVDRDALVFEPEGSTESISLREFVPTDTNSFGPFGCDEASHHPIRFLIGHWKHEQYIGPGGPIPPGPADPPIVAGTPLPCKVPKDWSFSLQTLPIAPGTKAHIIGCKQGANLVRCGDGVDAVVEGERHPFSNLRFHSHHMPLPEGLLLLILTFCTAVGAHVVLPELLPREPEKGEP